MKKAWWEKGVKFECQGSAKCCLSRGQYGFVYLTDKDRKRMAGHFGLSVREFTKQYCEKTEGHYHLKEDPKREACQFLEDKRCGVYEARPTQCRTWPFWPEVMGAKSWDKEVASFCPGVGRGEIVPADKIRKVLKEQERADS